MDEELFAKTSEELKAIIRKAVDEAWANGYLSCLVDKAIEATQKETYEHRTTQQPVN